MTMKKVFGWSRRAATLVAGTVLGFGLSAGVAFGSAGHDEEGEEGAPHVHDRWVDAPPAYAARRWDRWDDAAVAAKGRRIYESRCAACHGADGRGTGPLAAGLAHRPADLTHHFHGGAGTPGDAYLFWRVSEGGTVEPFRSAGSAMPAFKGVLDEKDRWAVLTYVHQAFHKGGAHSAGSAHRDGHDGEEEPAS